MTQAIQPPKIANSLREHPVDATGLRSPKVNARPHEQLTQQVSATIASKPTDKVELSAEAMKLATKPNVTQAAATPPPPAAKPRTPTDVATGKNINQAV